MKYKSLLAAVVTVIIAVTSCGTKQKNINEQLVGLWSGVDTIQIAAMDTLGNISVETIMVPVVVEYFADTTINGKVHYNDSTAAEIDAVVFVGDPYISYSGVMAINDKQQNVRGELFYNENPESLTMEFFSQDPETGAQHSGKGVLTRKTK